MSLHKEYVTLPNGQEIEFSIYFNKSRTNWATGQSQKIGYRVSATPVKRTVSQSGFVMIEFGMFTGFSDILLEVDRQSAKRLETAKNVLKDRKETYLQKFMPVTA